MPVLRCFLVFLLLVNVFPLLAQSSNSILVNAGEDVTKVIPQKEQLLYPEFQDGQLIYPQGKRSEVLKLNYNILVGAMKFIDYKGDTLFIAEDSNIFKYVQIGSDLYFHDYIEGYFEILTREGDIKLMVQVGWEIARREAVVNNGYGNSSSVGSSEYTSRRSTINTFVQNENTLFTKDISWFLLGPKDKIYKAIRIGFLKAFSDHRKEIKEFLNDNSIDFQSTQDLKTLLAFCQGLSSS